MTSSNFHDLIFRDLNPQVTGSGEVADIAWKIVLFFEDHDPTHHSHLSFTSFMDILGSKPSCQDYLYTALTYLSGDRVPLLNVGFEVYDEVNGEFVTISQEDIHSAELEGELFNPATGELIDNYEDKILVYFEPKKLARELYANG